MDAATILLIVAAAGQAGWTPDRSSAPTQVAAPQYDRYAQPPAAGSSVRVAGGSSTSSPSASPFGATNSTAPSTTAATRSGVAPPPWTGSSASSATSAPDWDLDASGSGPSLDGSSSSASSSSAPNRSENGWTSIGSQVAAPPLLVPRLSAVKNTAPSWDPPASSEPGTITSNSPRQPLPNAAENSSRQSPPPASGADSWARGWSNDAGAAPPTISRSGGSAAQGNGGFPSDLIPIQTADSRSRDSQSSPAQAARQQSQNNWDDLWGDKDPWADLPQTLPAGSSPPVSDSQQPAAGTVSAAGPANHQVSQPSQPIMAPPASNAAPPATPSGVVQTSAGTAATQSAASPAPAAEPPPWVPLLVVSLSLAGSLGANLFLGWSYLDARQKYSALVRKTADTFRRKAAA